MATTKLTKLRRRLWINKPSKYFDPEFLVYDVDSKSRKDEYSYSGNRGTSIDFKKKNPKWHIDCIYDQRFNKQGRLEYLIIVKEKTENGAPYAKEWVFKDDWAGNKSFLDAESIYRDTQVKAGDTPWFSDGSSHMQKKEAKVGALIVAKQFHSLIQEKLHAAIQTKAANLMRVKTSTINTVTLPVEPEVALEFLHHIVDRKEATLRRLQQTEGQGQYAVKFPFSRLCVSMAAFNIPPSFNYALNELGIGFKIRNGGDINEKHYLRFRFFKKTRPTFSHDLCLRCNADIYKKRKRHSVPSVCNPSIENVKHSYFLSIRFQVKEISSDINKVMLGTTKAVAKDIKAGIAIEEDDTDVSEISEEEDDIDTSE